MQRFFRSALALIFALLLVALHITEPPFALEAPATAYAGAGDGGDGGGGTNDSGDGDGSDGSGDGADGEE